MLDLVTKIDIRKHESCLTNPFAVADPDIPFGGGGGHEMRLNAKGTVGSFGGRNLIYNKIITQKI